MITKDLFSTLNIITDIIYSEQAKLKRHEIHCHMLGAIGQTYLLINTFEKLKNKDDLIKFHKDLYSIQEILFSLRGTIKEKKLFTRLNSCIDTFIVQLYLFNKDIKITELTHNIKVVNYQDWVHFPISLYDNFEECRNKKYEPINDKSECSPVTDAAIGNWMNTVLPAIAENEEEKTKKILHGYSLEQFKPLIKEDAINILSVKFISRLFSYLGREEVVGFGKRNKYVENILNIVPKLKNSYLHNDIDECYSELITNINSLTSDVERYRFNNKDETYSKYKYNMKDVEVAFYIKNIVKSISVVKETVLKNKEKESN